MKIKLEERIISIGDSIQYVPVTPDYGRAEFIICPIFRYGSIKECFIYPAQQHTDYYFKLVIPAHLKLRTIYFSGHCPNESRIWKTFWCKEHKCHSLEFYVPDGDTTFKVNSSFGDSLTFDWH